MEERRDRGREEEKKGGGREDGGKEGGWGVKEGGK